jgi:hypothetical protein
MSSRLLRRSFGLLLSLLAVFSYTLSSRSSKIAWVSLNQRISAPSDFIV